MIETTSRRTGGAGRAAPRACAERQQGSAAVAADRLLLPQATGGSRMISRYVFGATAVVFALGLATVEYTDAQQRRDGNLLPQEQDGQVTAVGCLLRGSEV